MFPETLKSMACMLPNNVVATPTACPLALKPKASAVKPPRVLRSAILYSGAARAPAARNNGARNNGNSPIALIVSASMDDFGDSALNRWHQSS